jgi:hypothetical protein
VSRFDKVMLIFTLAILMVCAFMHTARIEALEANLEQLRGDSGVERASIRYRHKILNEATQRRLRALENDYDD